MPESDGKHCGHCGATLLPRRRYCVACLALVPNAPPAPEGRLNEITRQIPTTRRPDKTMVFVPELHEARIKRERRNRRAFIAAMVTCAVIAAVGTTVWRVHEHKQAVAKQQRREVVAREELDQYAKSLELFFTDFGRYPTNSEGLAVLYRPASTLAAWRGPYIDKDHSVDPWGSDYVYQAFNDGAGYILSSYGPEGEAAGRVFLQVHSGSTTPSVKPTS
jgi:general secretion pathway protein G